MVIFIVYLAERKHHRLGTDIVPMANSHSVLEKYRSDQDEL
jgi:hypothetical protein